FRGWMSFIEVFCGIQPAENWESIRRAAGTALPGCTRFRRNDMSEQEPREPGAVHRASDECLMCAVEEHTVLAIVNTPHNPTGSVIGRSEIEHLARALKDSPLLSIFYPGRRPHQQRIISDYR